MVSPINTAGLLQPLAQPILSPSEKLAPEADALSFQKLLIDSFEQTTGIEQSAESAIETSLAGGNVSQVEVFSAVKKADLSLRMMLQIRNKLVDAFNEIQQLRM